MSGIDADITRAFSVIQTPPALWLSWGMHEGGVVSLLLGPVVFDDCCECVLCERLICRIFVWHKIRGSDSCGDIYPLLMRIITFSVPAELEDEDRRECEGALHCEISFMFTVGTHGCNGRALSVSETVEERD